ncbi:SLC13 family permease [Barrientosiimonas endolithica]|uniref:Arsenic transporter n=1 Tax=Barrientosiimonas endolithica TaxID=1535208 RepID=A0ABM8HBS4_9MICO|nr:SLC13 family permease [Barrientosiimonas endolithica]BDZ58402.1 arsenic transporter [Barrientosiimonas endolithica]
MTALATEAAGRVLPVLLFLLAITVVAEIATLAGVFDVAAHRAARAGRGRTWLLWLLVVVLSTVSTVLLSLDTTAVLLTPVVIAVARQLRLPALPFAMTTVWLANTASLLLPVSNLTNLLALHRFQELGLGTHEYLALARAPALAAVVATVVVLAVLFRHELSGRYALAPPAGEHDRWLLAGSTGVLVALAAAVVAGVPPAGAATAAAVALVVLTAWRDAALLLQVQLPWRMIGLTGVLLLLVLVVAQTAPVETLTRHLSDAPLWQVPAVAALLANGVNNLPAYLALEPALDHDPTRLMALLIGTNVGPLLTLHASLATLLWRDRCRRAGVVVEARAFAARSALVVVLAVASATAALLWRT